MFFMIYFTILSVFQYLDYIVSDVRMINDLERILKEIVEVLSWHFLGEGYQKPQLQ
jgi:hypothetical protein